MSETIETGAAEPLPDETEEDSGLGSDKDLEALRRRRGIGMAGFLVLLTGAYSLLLLAIVRYTMGTEIHSHVVLVPFVTGWLLWTERGHLEARFGTSVAGSILFALVGIVALVTGWGGWIPDLSQNDQYSIFAASYLSLAIAGGFLFLGTEWMKKAAFPVFFLVFTIPLPDGAVIGIEQGLVLASAEASDWLFQLSGTPVFRVGQSFHLPGFSLQVAQECSGVRSSWVLFITSLLASHLFLRTKWRQILLVAFVIPLGVVRNGFRILVIGLLCVHRGPHMIDSWIHHHGGPVFFALSLIPLFVLLWWLRRGDFRQRQGQDESAMDHDDGDEESVVSA